MGEGDKARASGWSIVSVIINGLILGVMVITLFLTVIRVFPLLSEKLEVQVTQVNDASVETLRVSRGQMKDGKESVILSIPFELRVVNIGKTDARQKGREHDAFTSSLGNPLRLRRTWIVAVLLK